MRRKTIIRTLCCLLLVATAVEATAKARENQDFAYANTAYETGDYAAAIEGYRAVLAGGEESWEVYYNLGNSYYRADSIGLCILNYERALRLSPGKKEIKDNLALANSKTVDRIEVLPTLFLVEWFRSILNLFTPRGWRVCCIVLMVLTCAAVSMFLISRAYLVRRALFVVSAVLGFFLLLTLFNAAFSAKSVSNRNEAIITAPMVVVKGSPDVKSVDKFILHEGTKLKITDRQDAWWQVEISDGKSGWIDGGAEEI